MKKFSERIVSAVLLLTILATSMCFPVTAVTVDPEKSDISFTDAVLVSENYSELNDYEKTILSCSALTGDVHNVAVPKDNSIVVIDTVNKKVTAADFVDGNYTWKAVSGVVKYSNDAGVAQTPISFTITDTVGYFTCPSDRYVIDVTYELDVNVDADRQRKLLNASSYLVKGAINMDILFGFNGYLESLAENFDSLYSLTTGEISKTLPNGGTVSVKLPADKDATKAIVALHDELEANGGEFVLHKLLNQYYNSQTETFWMIENGATVRTKVAKLYAALDSITKENSALRAFADNARDIGFAAQADQIEKAVNYIDQFIVSELMYVNNDPWDFLSHELVNTAATDAEQAALDAAVAGAINRQTSLVSEHNGVTVKNPLKAASTVLSQGVNQYAVSVIVKAEVVGKNSVASKTLTTLSETKRTSFVFDKDTPKADILAAIENSGIKNDAIAAWDSYYGINETNYNVTVSGLTDTLGADLECTVLFTPKNFEVQYNYATTVTDTVPYGYNILLEKNSDPSKSYDYTVNTHLLREDTVYRVISDTAISRSESKAIVKYSVASIIANSTVPGGLLTSEEKSVLVSQGLNEEYLWYRAPAQETDLVSIAAGANTGDYTVTAPDYSSGLTSGATWKAVKGYLVDASGNDIYNFTISNQSGSYSYLGDYDHIRVEYELVMTDVTLAKINEYINLPNTLVSDSAVQKQKLTSLTDSDIYNSLAEIYGSRITLIEGLTNCKDAVRQISSECIDSTASGKPLYLYEYIQEYKARGLAYYYEGDNAAKITRQIDLLRTNLNIIWADSLFQENLLSPDIAKYKDKLETIRDKMNAIDLAGINTAVNSSSDYIGSLVTAIEAASGKTAAHTVTSGEITLNSNVSVSTPDKATVEVVVNVLNGKGNPVAASEKGSRSFSIGRVLDANDITLINSLVSELESKFTFDKTHSKFTVSGPALTSGYTLSNLKTTVTYTWEPVSYTAKIDSANDQVFKADGNLTITLPGCSKTNFSYIYTIGNEEIPVGSSDKTYTFANLAAVDNLFGISGTYTIARREIDVYREETLNFINDLNEIIADRNMTFSMNGKETLVASFIPLENETTGEISVVLRISPVNSGADYESALTDVANAIIDAYFDYIGFDGSAFWDGKIHLQSLIDMITGSDLGFDTILNLIDSNGNINEMTSLSSLKVIGADADGNIPVNGKVINDTGLLGGKILESSLQLGTSASDCKNLPLYITMEDFDREASNLKRVRDGVTTAKKYANIQFKDDKLNITATLPDSVYSYYSAAMLIAGNADVRNFNNPNFEADAGYILDLIKPLFANSAFTSYTVENTADKANYNLDLSSYSGTFNTLRKAINNIFNNTSEEGQCTGSEYTGTFKYDIKQLLVDKLGLSDTVTKFLAEATTDTPEATPAGLTLPISCKLTNMDNEYEAFIIDKSASAKKIVRLVRDLESEMTGLKNDTLVILLKDVDFDSDVTVSKSILLDLNGYTVNGNIKSASTGTYGVSILDSRMGTYDCGSVNGTLNGKFTITGGQYDTDVTGMLKNGYVQDSDGYVTNKLYTTSVAANGDINVKISGDVLNINNLPALRVFAADLGGDVIGNYFTSAAIEIEGNTIYDIDMDDLVGYVNKSLTSLAGDAVECADTAGITAFANAFLDDLTDFAAVKAAIESGAPIVSYTVKTSPWDISLSLAGQGKDNYLTADIGSSTTESTSTKLNISLSNKATAEDRNNLANLFGELAKTVTINELDVTVVDLTYDGSFKYDIRGKLDAIIDFTSNPDYAAVLAILLANTSTGAVKAELVEAVQEYIDSGIVGEMKAALEKVTLAQLVKALKGTKADNFATVMESLGLKLDSILNLEKIYDDVFTLCKAAVQKLGVTGNSTTLGRYAKAGEYGTYQGSATRKDVEVSFVLKLFNPDKDIVVRTASGIVAYNASEIVKALSERANGDIIYINNPAALDSDVTVSAAITIIKAANLNMNGFRITLKSPAASITADDDLGYSNILSDSDAYRVSVTSEGGTYVYSLTLRAIAVYDANGNFAAEYAENQLAEALRFASDGYTVAINTDAVLGSDVELTASISIRNAARISFEDKKIILTTAGTTFTSDSALPTDALASGVAGYAIKVSEDSGRFVYSLSLCAIVVVHSDLTETVYEANALKTALENSVDGDTIYLNTVASLTSDATVNCGINIINADNITFVSGSRIILKNIQGAAYSASVKVDKDISVTNFTSGSNYYEVIKTAVTGGYTLSLRALVPYIYNPTINVSADGLIRGGAVDLTSKYIVLDVDPSGMTASQLSLVIFNCVNTETKTVTVRKGDVIRSSTDLVCNGDTITVTAENGTGESASVTYTICILGDANANGRIDSGDAVRMNAHFIGQRILTGDSLLAADTNRNGRIDSGDAVNISSKFTYSWNNYTYVSALNK